MTQVSAMDWGELASWGLTDSAPGHCLQTLRVGMEKKAQARGINGEIISKWKVFKARTLEEIIKGVSEDER